MGKLHDAVMTGDPLLVADAIVQGGNWNEPLLMNLGRMVRVQLTPLVLCALILQDDRGELTRQSLTFDAKLEMFRLLVASGAEPRTKTTAIVHRNHAEQVSAWDVVCVSQAGMSLLNELLRGPWVEKVIKGQIQDVVGQVVASDSPFEETRNWLQQNEAERARWQRQVEAERVFNEHLRKRVSKRWRSSGPWRNLSYKVASWVIAVSLYLAWLGLCWLGWSWRPFGGVWIVGVFAFTGVPMLAEKVFEHLDQRWLDFGRRVEAEEREALTLDH